MRKTKNITLWILWLVLSLGLGSYLAYGLWGEIDGMYLPDTGSHGHYQIELACEACHGNGFQDEDAMQTVCTDCHGAELKLADDSHPVNKFTDPRNADRIEILDARYCVTCHVEHVPERTRVMGVTLADDFCVLCHAEVSEERPSHKDLSFDGCSAAGCHNYHDNRALYEDFLVKHATDPATDPQAVLPMRNYQQIYTLAGKQSAAPLNTAGMDGGSYGNDPVIINSWAESAHAQAGINCSDCHQSPWQDRPTIAVCNDCHKGEMDGFVAGRHGMRLAQALTAMNPADARQSMKDDAHNSALNCNSCHNVHSVNTKRAAVEACQTCHDDVHSNAYQQSVHYKLWQQELAGDLAPGSGVSCASCHLPRIEVNDYGERTIRVQHNQNSNLRPNEKMIREVCMHCHGLDFSINALADSKLINKNFAGKPSQHIKSIEMAVGRVKKE